MNKIISIFDTSLRDGAQTAGVNMSPEGKISLAEKIDEFGIDKIEGGFPISSEGDFRAVKTISEIVRAQVYGLSRLDTGDIDTTFEALKNSNNRGIHTFIGTSPLHREYKLKLSKEQIIEKISKDVKYARNKFKNDSDAIMFSAEDGMRTEIEFLFQAFDAAVKAGATEINLPDTVGYTQFFEIYELIGQLVERYPGIGISVHTHNDLGNAVSNSLAAIKGGATIVQGTIPPAYGERAGNADLIQVLMNLIKRKDYYGVDSKNPIDMTKVYSLVSSISNIIGKRIPDNYPIVGSDVHRHSSGIHQDGAKKHAGTYEIISPEEIGYKIEQSFILTNQSGKAGLVHAINSYFGLELDDDKIKEVFNKFKKLTSNSNMKFVTMDDIREVLVDSGIEITRNIKIGQLDIHINSNREKTIASVDLFVNGRKRHVLIEGDGPVDATYKAIIKSSGIDDIVLKDFNITNLGYETSAEAKVYINIEHHGKIYEEFGVDKDIVKAAVKACVNCIDRISKN